MVTLRNLALLAIAAALSAGAGNAQAGKGNKKNGGHELKGVVVSVHAGKDGGTFTIKTHGKKGGKAGAKGAKPGGKAGKGGHMMRIEVNAQTQFLAVHKKQARAVTGAALKPGEHVAVVTSDGHTASKVMIHGGKKKKQK